MPFRPWKRFIAPTGQNNRTPDQARRRLPPRRGVRPGSVRRCRGPVHGEGVPECPRAWIIQTARHKAVDRIRHQTRFGKKLEFYASGLLQAREEPDYAERRISDDRPRLILTGCTPPAPPWRHGRGGKELPAIARYRCQRQRAPIPRTPAARGRRDPLTAKPPDANSRRPVGFKKGNAKKS